MGVLLENGKVILVVEPGVCRLTSKVEAWIEDGVVRCTVESGCSHVREFAEKLDGLQIMEIMKMPYSENKVYQVAGRTLKHSTCILPAAVLKAMEAATGLALRRDVSLKFEKGP